MRELVKWMLPVILAVTPVFGAQEDEKTFLNKPGAIYSIAYGYEDTNLADYQIRFNAAVDRTLPDASSAQKDVVARFRHEKWQMDDERKVGKSVGQVFVICNGETISKSFTRQDTPYEIVSRAEAKFLEGGKMLPDGQPLPARQVIEVRQVTTYKRPDTSHFVESGDLLHSLFIEEETKALGKFFCCVREFKKGIKQEQRHDIEGYDGSEVKRITFKILHDAQERAKISDEIQKILVRTHNMTDRPNHYVAPDIGTATELPNTNGWIVKR